MNSISTLTSFVDQNFLRQHIRSTLSFYHPHAVDPEGGFFHYFRDDGSVYDASHRHLVSSTRFVFVYAMAAIEFGDSQYLDRARHGLQYIRQHHYDPVSSGYIWTSLHGQAEDRTQHCYGTAFVMLAYATAIKAGLNEAKPWLAEVWQLMEKRFWDKQAGLYRDEANENWLFSSYRGQNANMHSCEALLAAYEATHERIYLDRAYEVAQNITRRQAGKTAGIVWEHFDENWNVDWDYHRDNPKDLFRPWGFQTGHQTEWTKLLLTLERHVQKLESHDTDWLLPTAEYLFNTAIKRGWDSKYAGLVYGFDPVEGFCDTDKYFWVQAESLAAAALLGQRTNEDRYWQWYTRLWAYAWTHFVDHEQGAWYRILNQQNAKMSDEKSPAGKVDYHTMGACYEVLALVRRSNHL